MDLFKGKKVKHKLDGREIMVVEMPNVNDTAFLGRYVNKVTGEFQKRSFIPEEVENIEDITITKGGAASYGADLE